MKNLEISQLKLIVSSYNAIVSFIEGGRLAETLSLLGATELKAARDALRNLESFSDKKSHVNGVKTHLETAHAAFSSIWNPDSLLKQHIGSAYKLDSAETDIWTLCLLIMCYIYLQEYKAIRHLIDEIEKTREAVFHLTHNCPDDEYQALKIAGSVVDLISEHLKPSVWYKAVTGQRQSLYHASLEAIHCFLEEVSEFEKAVIKSYTTEASLFDYRSRI
jgi:hypothetical protein